MVLMDFVFPRNCVGPGPRLLARLLCAGPRSVHAPNFEVALPALQAGGDDKLFNENNKKFDVIKGSIEMKVTLLS